MKLAARFFAILFVIAGIAASANSAKTITVAQSHQAVSAAFPPPSEDPYPWPSASIN